jgi:uncharacterized protein YybS (DUF2232 family)
MWPVERSTQVVRGHGWRDHLGGPGSIILIVMTTRLMSTLSGDGDVGENLGPHSLYQLSICTNYFPVLLGLWYQQIVCTNNLIVLQMF